MLPQEIVNATKEYKNNSTRILVLILLLFSAGMVVAYKALDQRDNSKSDRDIEKLEARITAQDIIIAGKDQKIDSLTKEIKYLWIDRTKSQEDFKGALKKIEDILNKKK